MRLIALLLLAGTALACGPFFDDAHHGQEERLLLRLEPWCWRLLHPGGDHRAQVLAFRQAVEEARRAEGAGGCAAATAAWRRAAGLDCGSAHRPWLDPVGERLALAALALPDAEALRLAAALDQPVAAQGELPAALVEAAAGDGPAAALAADAILVRLFAAGRCDEAEERLDNPGALAAADAAWFAACLPVARALARRSALVADPAAVLAGLDAWCRGNPGHARLAATRGWMAMVLHHHPALAWDGASGVEAAARIYAGLLADPAAARLFTPVVGSLRLSFRLLRPRPPAWVLADRRLAALWAYHAVSDRDRRAGGDGPAVGAEALAAAAAILAERPEAVEPLLALALAHACQVAGDARTGLALARRADGTGPEVLALGCRLACDAGDAAGAGRWLERLAAADPGHPLLRDLHLRLGNLHERAGDAARALALYCRGNSALDVEICADGEIAPADLAALVDGGEDLRARAADTGAVWLEARPPGFDWRGELRQILGIRLARRGRWAQARPLLDPQRAVLVDRLLDLEAAARPQDPAARLALALFWYEQGRPLLFRSRHWHQWAFGPWGRAWARFRAEGGDPAEQARWRRRGEEVEAMSAYQRAFPLFVAVADGFPDDPRAATALWYAAHCRWWPCGPTYLGVSDYWLAVAQEQGYWAQGEALLRRLAAEHPGHPLAREPKVLRARAAAPAR